LHDTLASTGRDVLHPLRIILKERKKKLACAPLAPFEFPQLFLSLIQQHLSQGSADTLVEGLEKATRGGGGEWEPIKIPHRNLAYVQNKPNVPLF
jgi:hypothetical protein